MPGSTSAYRIKPIDPDCRGEDRELPLEHGAEYMRRDDRNGQAAQRAAGGHHKIVGR